MLKTLRMISLVFIMGAATGGYGAYEYEHANTAHVMNLALRGNCSQPDVDGHPYWFACADYYIAAQIQQHDAERDAEVTKILNDMAKAEPKAKIVRAKHGE